MAEFSSALKLTDLDDFITPSQACVQPEIIERKEKRKATIQVKEDGTYLEYDDQGNGEILESAKISLVDCLACSGCVTSAETVLITAQSTQEFLESVKGGDKTVMVSISPQSRASLAVHFGLDLLQTHKKLITLFKKVGAHYVFDTSFSREFALMESGAEFVARYRKQLLDSPLPMLASSCPGWICYAEKTHGEFVLPYISSTKSPQQIMGTIAKKHFAKSLGVTPDKVYHVTIMPCYDKKLEASRKDFYDDIFATRDVDCVLATTEILDLLEQSQLDFATLEESPLDQPFTNVNDAGRFFGISGGSGGYLEYIFRYAAKELFGVTVGEIEYKNLSPRSQSNDLRAAYLKVDGKTVLTFVAAYGFKNIQHVIRKLKRKNCTYDFVEVMACPGGCLNGGGQMKPPSGKTPKQLLQEVEDVYHSQDVGTPESNLKAQELYNLWFQGIFSPDSQTMLHTAYHAVEKLVNPLLIKW